MIWNDLHSIIDTHQSFLISSHANLDGDSIGSQLAFCWYLTSLGKKVALYNKDPVPAQFLFLNNIELMRTGGGEPDPDFDVFVVLDASYLSRLGWNTDRCANKPTINFDHHRDNGRFGTFNAVVLTAAATGEIMYQFFTENKIDFPAWVAEALYVAVMTDTGGFRFPNTSSKVLHLCADLAARGADPAKIYEKVYATQSRAALELKSRIWSSLKFFLDGRVCCLELPLKLFKELGARQGDSEGMVDNAITVEDVQVGFLVKYSETETHFSLRSKGTVDVGRIAQKIPGGGGHSGAAGCTLKKPFSSALPEMLEIIKQELHYYR